MPMSHKASSIFAALLAPIVIFTLAGCGKPAEESATESAAPTPAAEAANPAAPAAPAAPAPEATNSMPPAASAVDLPDPVATVDGEKITRAQLDEALGEAVAASGIEADALTAEQKMEGYRQILDDLIMDKLLGKAAEGIQVSQAEVDAEIAKLKGQFPTEEEFKAQLDAVGQTPDKLAETLSKIMKQRQWVESQIGESTAVTEADAKKFYEENQSEFEQPEQVKASHILFLVKPDDSEEAAKAQLEKAKEAAAKAKKGGDFSALAKESSEEPGAKESGGDLGFFTKDRMVPEFAEAAFTLKPGDISEPVRTQFGWHVIKVEEKKPAGMSPFEEVKDQLEAYLKADKQRKAVQDLMKSLREKANVESALPPPAAPPGS